MANSIIKGSLLLVTIIAFNNVCASTVESDFGLIQTKTIEPINNKVNEVKFNGFPVSLLVEIGREKNIQFNKKIKRVGIPSAVENGTDLLSYEVYDKKMLLRLNKNISTRIKVVLDNGTIVPINIIGTSEVTTNAIFSVLVSGKDSDATQQEVYERNYIPRTHNQEISQLDIIRRAHQEIYAPKRLQDNTVPLLTINNKPKRNVKIYKTGMVEIDVIKEMKSGNNFVTLCKVTNKNKTSVNLDPRLIRGEFTTASFYNNRLLPSNTKKNVTLLVLISNVAFNQALPNWVTTNE